MKVLTDYIPFSPKKESFAVGLRIFLSLQNRKKALLKFVQPAINKNGTKRYAQKNKCGRV
jgi:hypothetical protein